jgi:ComF family protein
MLSISQEAWYGLCRDCMESLGIHEEDRCLSCGRPLISEKERCLPCREGEVPSFDRIFAIYPYAGTYQKLLRSYKFGKRPALAHFFAERLTLGLAALDLPPEAERPAWVPVPPRPGKIKKTGWDQIEYLAKVLEKENRQNRGREIPVCRCLKRLPSKSQKELNRQTRQTNLRGKIYCTQNPPATAVLFDDVITTGSTLEACAAALKAGGAEKVYGVCLFYD